MDKEFKDKIKTYVVRRGEMFDINPKIYPDYKRYKLYTILPKEYTDTNIEFNDTPLNLSRVISVKQLSEDQKRVISYFHSINKLDYNTFGLLLEEDNLSENGKPIWMYNIREAIELNSAIIKEGIEDTLVGKIFNISELLTEFNNFINKKDVGFIPYYTTTIDKIAYDLGKIIHRKLSDQEIRMITTWLERFGMKCQKVRMLGLMQKENVTAFNIDMYNALKDYKV